MPCICRYNIWVAVKKLEILQMEAAVGSCREAKQGGVSDAFVLGNVTFCFRDSWDDGRTGRTCFSLFVFVFLSLRGLCRTPLFSQMDRPSS